MKRASLNINNYGARPQDGFFDTAIGDQFVQHGWSSGIRFAEPAWLQDIFVWIVIAVSGAVGLLLLGYGERKSRDFPGYAALTVAVAWPFLFFAVWLTLVGPFGWHLWPRE